MPGLTVENWLDDLVVDRLAFVDRGAIRDPLAPTEPNRFFMWKAEDSIAKAQWSTAFVNDLPDDSFAYIAPGGKKDEEGKTTPRANRYFPFKNADGKIDLPHLRNALARLPQSSLSADVKSSVQTKLEAAAKEAGVETAKKGEDPAYDDLDEDVKGAIFEICEAAGFCGDPDERSLDLDSLPPDLTGAIYELAEAAGLWDGKTPIRRSEGGPTKLPLSEEVKKSLEAAAALIAEHKDELPDEVVKSLDERAGLAKADPEKAPSNHENTVPGALALLDEQKDKLTDDHKKKLRSLAGVAKAEGAEGGDEASPIEGISKAEFEALPAGVRAHLQKQAEDTKSAVELAKAERRTRLLKEEEVRIAKDYRALPGVKAADFAEVTLTLKEEKPELFEKLEPVLKSASATIEKSEIFKTSGREGGDDGDETPTGQIQKRAEEIRKAEPKLTEAQAWKKAMDENPELAAAASRASRGFDRTAE